MNNPIRAVIGAGLLTFIFAGTVAAHNGSTTLTCGAGLTVHLTQFQSSQAHPTPNTIVIEIDGDAVSGSTFHFGASFDYNSGPLNPFVGHSAHVAVDAVDGTAYDFVWNKEIGPCQTPTPTPSPTPRSTPSPTPSPTSTPRATPTDGPTATPSPSTAPSVRPTPSAPATTTPHLTLPPTATTPTPGTDSAPFDATFAAFLFLALVCLVLLTPNFKRTKP